MDQRFHMKRIQSTGLQMLLATCATLEAMGSSAESYAQTRDELLLSKLKEAHASCEQYAYEEAGKLFKEVIEAINSARPRILYSNCLQKQGNLIEAHRQCLRAFERAQVAIAGPSGKKNATLLQQDEFDARQCVNDLESRIPKLLVHVSGPAVDDGNLRLYVNNKPIDSSHWGKPYPMNPGMARVTGITSSGPLAPMAVMLIERRNESLQVSIQQPTKWEMHRPSALIGVGIPTVAIGIVAILFGAFQADTAHDKWAANEANRNISSNTLQDGAMKHVVYASLLGAGGMAMSIGGVAMFATGLRELKSEKQGHDKVARFLTLQGFGIGGRF